MANCFGVRFDVSHFGITLGVRFDVHFGITLGIRFDVSHFGITLGIRFGRVISHFSNILQRWPRIQCSPTPLCDDKN